MMESHIVLAIIALALIMVSGTPIPSDSIANHGPVFAVKLDEPINVAVAPTTAEQRADSGEGGGGFMSLPPVYTSPFFGGKRPFEYISGPYHSNSVYGQPFQGGPFGGLGIPLSNGPLGGIMSVPLLYMMG